ncbi:hypothetical protein PCL_10079 [Purpureocillium lilacinum]|uniref:Uncharacterized protein n=1 Tax=Purpureocillium lilacinum TaxID=33203 RepID=A0A2U3EEW9_PURLI|nr:hypothetical protein PCL_10079 [Purpureocillium lilacinum]
MERNNGRARVDDDGDDDDDDEVVPSLPPLLVRVAQAGGAAPKALLSSRPGRMTSFRTLRGLGLLAIGRHATGVPGKLVLHSVPRRDGGAIWGEEGGQPAGRDRAPRHRLRRMVQVPGVSLAVACIVLPYVIMSNSAVHRGSTLLARAPEPPASAPPSEQSGQHYRDRRRCRSGSGEESVPSAARASFHRRWGFGAGAAPHTVWALDSAVARPQPKIQRETPG